MQLIQVVKYLEQIAISSPYIRSTGEGSVYTIMNGNPHSKYGVFVISQNQHYRDEYFDHFNFNLFVIDRLIDDLDSNRLQVQSIAKECLTNILLTFKEKFYGVTYNTIRFNVFTEKFVDLCAGAYAQVEIIIPANLICPDDYGIEFDKDYTLKPLVVEITENGVYEYEPDNFDGYDKVTVTVNVDIPDNYESGFTSGVTYQKSLLSAITITENGEYITDENGVSAITVDVSGYTQDDLDDAYQSGFTSGVTYQKSLLSAITIDHNGEFINVNGYSAITVNVPQTGESVNNQSKIVEISGNGSYTITYDEGYTGLEVVIINVNVSGDTPTPPTPSGDTSAYTDMYLTTLALDSGIIRFEVQTGQTFMLQYRKNKGEWVSASQGVIENNVVVGDIIEYKSLKGSTYGHFSSNCEFIAYGNAMSLLYGDDFSGKTTFQSTTYTLNGLFIDCSGLTSVKHLVLPATALTQNAYNQMFRGCTNLIDSPELPATKIANWCYKGMFSGCTSLTNAPVLYDVDFGPAGSASPQGAFEDMFKGCSSLNNIKCYISNKTTYPDNEFIFGFWVNGVSPTGTFTKAEGVNWETGISGIPNNWTVIEN